ncbi:MAG: DNA-formamidopyrimidine glycosylase family protein, partial [Rhodanobacteraceae bacterium]
MPELPEVETTRRGIAPFVTGRVVTRVVLRRPDLRWPIPRAITTTLPGQRIDAVERRAKYLLLHTEAGSALLHLGMSGSLRLTDPALPPRPHDHYDLVFDSGNALRFNDPRRFGCLLWQEPGEVHPLLRDLGPEPLGDAFEGDWLFAQSRGRSVAVKSFLMDQTVVVG